MVTRSSLKRQNQPVETARLNEPVSPAQSAASPAASPSASPSAPALPPSPLLRDRKGPAGKPLSSPPLPDSSGTRLNPVANAAEERAEKKKADKAGASLSKTERAEVDRPVNGRLDPSKASAPPPPPARGVADSVEGAAAQPAVPQAANSMQSVAGQLPPPPQVQVQGFVAGQNQQAPQAGQNQGNQSSQIQTPGAAGRGGGGGVGAGFGRAKELPLNARAAAKDASPRFGFEYKVEGEDLVFRFTADGYFSLHIVPGGLTIIDSHVAAGTTRREHITINGTEADIVFSAAPQSSTGGVKLTSNLKADTAEDPSRTRIELLVKFFPPPF